MGDLISVTPISLAFSKSSQIGPSSSNHLKMVPVKSHTDFSRPLELRGELHNTPIAVHFNPV